jgi:toluene monooxygenase system ferredoxin subunit
MAFHRVIAADELWDGEMLGQIVAGRKLLLVRLGERVCAYADRCAHLGVELSSGKLEGHVLTCSAHHYQYDARTGQGINPRRVALSRFAVKIESGQILVDPESEMGSTR